VAQRRRRVFVVGYLGDWRAAAAVLFERHSLSGHPAPRRETGERIAPCVTTGPPFSRTGNERVEAEAMVVSASYTPSSIGVNEKVCFTQNTTDRHAVAQPICLMDQGGSVMNIEHDMTGTLRRETHGHEPIVMQTMAVRRLTCVECERLQGFPDNYTDIKSKNKQTPDGPRYKALGNSMAVPVMRWIGERINKWTF